MVVHALSFFLYLSSTIWTLFAESWRYYITNFWYLVVGIFWISSYFLAQWILTVILYKLCSSLNYTARDSDEENNRLIVGNLIPQQKLFNTMQKTTDELEDITDESEDYDEETLETKKFKHQI
jgi:hypothetical protein